MIRVLLSALCSLQRRLSYLVTRRPEIWDCALTMLQMRPIPDEPTYTKTHMPSDLVVKSQAIDIAEHIS